MYFQSITEFLHMGRHGAYVWSAYGITLAAIIGIHLYNKARHRRLTALLAQLKDTEQ